MAILSTSTSGIFNIFYRKKETTVILKHIDELSQNLARVHNLIGSSTEVTKTSDFSILPIRFHCFLLFVYCQPFVPTLILN